jgi:hypothetical protein
MKTKFHWLVCLALLFSLVFTADAFPASAGACDPAFVTKSGSVFTVKPTTVDDTANLQCAFDLASAAGPGVTVRLLGGTYHTAQIVVNDFHGTFTGKGLKNTLVTNLPNLYVTPVDVIFNPPSVANPWPNLISFVEGDILVSNMAFHIKGGEDETTGWSIFGMTITELANAVSFIGQQMDVRVNAILVEGEAMENTLYGYSLINGVSFQGYFAEPPMPISGTFTVRNSILRTMGSGTPTASTSNASVLITRNTYENVFFSMDAADYDNSRLEFSYNKVNNAVFGLDLYNSWWPETSNSEFLIKNNVFYGTYGPVIEPSMGSGNTCLLIGNNVQNVTDIGIYLGAYTNGCTVVGGSNTTNVLDEGTGNILVGVNNMGAGIGPTIQTLFRLMK